MWPYRNFQKKFRSSRCSRSRFPGTPLFRVDPYKKNFFFYFFNFFSSKKNQKKSLIPTIYNTWVKDFRKWSKNVKISYFWSTLAICTKNSLFWCFWPISWNLWPKCYILLKSVIFSEFLRQIFFWLKNSDKSHWFQQYITTWVKYFWKWAKNVKIC